jgi:predicted  nucleic acid-binding Zn-ribbon protein
VTTCTVCGATYERSHWCISTCAECGASIPMSADHHVCDLPTTIDDALARAVRLLVARVDGMDASERAVWLDALFSEWRGRRR